MSYDPALIQTSQKSGIIRKGESIDGIHWNILGQVYSPKTITEDCFSWHATFPIESFVPPHIHPKQDEYLIVLSGELDILLDGKPQRAEMHDLVHLPKGIPHGIFNNSGADATCLFWVTPTGKLFDLFRKIHNMAHPGKVTEIAPAYDIEFLPAIRAAAGMGEL